MTAILDKSALPFMRALKQAAHILDTSYDLNKVRAELTITINAPFRSELTLSRAERQSAVKD